MTTILGPNGETANGNGGPWWAKDLRVVGPITLIAMGLVYLLAVDVRNDARAAAHAAETTQADLVEHQKHTEKLHQNIEDYMRVQNLLTRQLCVNSARNSQDRTDCFKP